MTDPTDETQPHPTALPPDAAVPSTPQEPAHPSRRARSGRARPRPGAARAAARRPAPPGRSGPPRRQRLARAGLVPAARSRDRDAPSLAAIVVGLVLIAVGVYYFLDRTLGIELPRIQWSSALADRPDRPRRAHPAPRRSSARPESPAGWAATDPTTDAGRPRGDPVPRRLAAHGSATPLRRGPAARRDDPAAALAHWRAIREALFREHPQSPVPADRRAAFRARHFDHDPALRFEVAVEPLDRRRPSARRRPARSTSATARRRRSGRASRSTCR